MRDRFIGKDKAKQTESERESERERERVHCIRKGCQILQNGGPGLGINKNVERLH